MNRRRVHRWLSCAWPVVASHSVMAQSPSAEPPAAPAEAVPARAAEPGAGERVLADAIIPAPDYSGDVFSRRFLTGDWGGQRAELANKGLTFDVTWVQAAQGVVSGGNRIDWDYGGNLDTVVNADLQRLGLMPGALLKFRAESRYGESVNDDTGAILPVNTAGSFPLTDRVNQGIPFTITELMYTQFLSKTFGVFAGKLQTLDGDPNEFAGGRGRTQFLNANFNLNGASALVVPYSTLGGGVVWIPSDQLLISSTMFNRTDSSTTSGFDHVENGWTWASEAQLQYRLGTLPGGVNLGGAYSFAGEFNQLGNRLQLIPGQGVALPTQSDSWFVYAGAWQYVYTPDQAPAKINLTDGRPDLRGIGLFARFGYADPDTNPLSWTASGGVGGRGLIPGRDEDTFGVAYVYTNLQELRASALLGIQDATQAVEVFYNFAFTPAVGFTIDAQWVDGGSRDVSDAVVLGARLFIRF